MEDQKAPPLYKICHTCPTMMKLGTIIPYLKKILKNIWITWHTPRFLLTSAFFNRKSATFVISRNTNTYFILIYNVWYIILLTFFESLKVALINKVAILLMSAKFLTLGLLKIKVFWKKDYDVIISVLDTTNKVLSCDSNYL